MPVEDPAEDPVPQACLSLETEGGFGEMVYTYYSRNLALCGCLIELKNLLLRIETRVGKPTVREDNRGLRRDGVDLL
jgi:hypothetical protein